MCLDILKNPVKSIAAAKKRKNMGKSLLAALESSVLLGLAGAIFLSGFSLAGSVTAAITVFLTALIGILLFGIVVHVSATTLGGKGKYFEGLTSVVYASLPISIGLLAVSILSLIPFTVGLQVIAIALSFASGISILYRGIKDLFGVDMLTSFIVVSVSLIAIFAAVYISVGVSLLGNISSMGMMI